MLNGLFISCKKNKELKAFKEVVSLFGTSLNDDNEIFEYEKVNIGNEINEEIKKMQKDKFKLYYSYKSIIYVENKTLIPPSKIYEILRHKNILFEYVQRIVPIDTFFTFNNSKIIDAIENLDRTKNYKIIYEERFTGKEMKNKVFEIITGKLNMKVDLMKSLLSYNSSSP